MSNTSIPEDRIPVIVGVGEIVDRPKEITAGLEPLTLLEEALKRAEVDSGAKLLGDIGSLDIVNFLSWRYRDPEQLLADRLGIKPAHLYYGPVGGESPIRYLHEAAQRIARGECSVAAQNPSSWLKKNFSPKQITTPTPDNRLIAWPYTKLMVANPSVNMGGALLLTSLAKARSAGVPEDRIVYAWGGASAEEPRDYLIRDQFFESHPQNAVLTAIMDLVEGDGKKFD